MGVLLIDFVREFRRIRLLTGRVVRQRENQAARRQSITRAIHACCSGSGRSANGDHPRLRSAINTSAAAALSGMVKPALSRPLGVSTNTRRRPCDIRLTIANGRLTSRTVAPTSAKRPPARDKPSDGMGAGAGRARATVLYVGTPDYFPRVALLLQQRGLLALSGHLLRRKICPLLDWPRTKAAP